MLKKIIYLISLLIVFNGLSFAQDSAAGKLNISPIVQLISYKDIFGKYVEMLGWGSASIINDQGIIISNNHVVDDGKGNIASAFSVCITKKEKERPVCDYTASLISRDEDMDISILKIDPYDIYGNKVNYSDFQIINIDYDYVPLVQDEVLAVGYPWIGADTITQTKGIVSGISQYNGFNYIKTDTTIAGGNSGGGLLNSKGELIGIPTFGIGGFSDPSLGYALSISEAKGFIEDNMVRIPSIKSTKIDFSSYKSQIDKINLAQYLKDDVFEFRFDGSYEIRNYIKNKKIELSPKKNKEISVNGMNIEVINTYDISKEKDFFYYIEKLGYYNKQYDKLQKTLIGGWVFYIPVSLQDVSGGTANGNKLYVTKLTSNSIVVITVSASLYDEKNNKKLQTEIQNILGGLKIVLSDKDLVLSDFDLNSPIINIKNSPNVVLNDRYGVAQGFFGNLNDNFIVSIYEKNLFEGKGQSIEDIFKAETNNINSDDYKTMITFKGHPGFSYCLSSYTSQTDINGNYIEQQNCYLKVYGFTGINNEEYYLNISLNVDKNKVKDYFDFLIKYLGKNVLVNSIGDGKTEIKNLLKNQVVLKFKDLSYQPEGFINSIKYLVKYKLIKNGDIFGGDTPLRWADFIDMYVRMVYNFDIYKNLDICKKDLKCVFEKYDFNIGERQLNLMKIIDEMGIELYDYVDSSKVGYFQTYFEIKLAGVNLPQYSEYYLSLFSGNMDESFFQPQKDLIKELNNTIFGYKKILIYDLITNVADYSSNLLVEYNYDEGVVEKTIKSKDEYDFLNKQPSSFIELNKCLLSKNYFTLQQCLIEYKKSCSSNGFEVLTKGKALNYIIPLIDFSLFDDSLKVKKDTIVSETYGE